MTSGTPNEMDHKSDDNNANSEAPLALVGLPVWNKIDMFCPRHPPPPSPGALEKQTLCVV